MPVQAAQRAARVAQYQALVQPGSERDIDLQGLVKVVHGLGVPASLGHAQAQGVQYRALARPVARAQPDAQRLGQAAAARLRVAGHVPGCAEGGQLPAQHRVVVQAPGAAHAQLAELDPLVRVRCALEELPQGRGDLGGSFVQPGPLGLPGRRQQGGQLGLVPGQGVGSLGQGLWLGGWPRLQGGREPAGGLKHGGGPHGLVAVPAQQAAYRGLPLGLGLGLLRHLGRVAAQQVVLAEPVRDRGYGQVGVGEDLQRRGRLGHGQARQRGDGGQRQLGRLSEPEPPEHLGRLGRQRLVADPEAGPYAQVAGRQLGHPEPLVGQPRGQVGDAPAGPGAQPAGGDADGQRQARAGLQHARHRVRLGRRPGRPDDRSEQRKGFSQVQYV
jgi:hypothetical protein